MNPSDIDGFLKRRREREKARSKTEAQTRFERVREDVGYLHRFWIQFVVACTWVWARVLRPFLSAVSWIFRALFRQYRKLWSLYVYRRNEHDVLRFSKVRGGLFIVATVATFYVGLNVLGVMYDATMYLCTARVNESLYLTSSQEVDVEGNVHSVKGCNSLPCSDEDSIYFRINPSGFNHIWSIAHNHSVFFPDYVAAAVPPGTNKCVVTTYGIRIKMLMRGFDIYPELLKASCSPIVNQVQIE